MLGRAAWRIAGLVVVVLALVSACGTVRATSVAASGASSAAQPAKSALPGICPQIPVPVTPSPCVSTGVQQLQQSDQMYNERKTLPAWLAAEAQPETQRVRESLERLTPTQRQQVSAVQSALLAAGMLSSGLVVSPLPKGVQFGGYEPFSTSPAVCAYGDVTANAVVVNIGGNTLEGACA